MKKLIAAFLALTLILSLAACGGSSLSETVKLTAGDEETFYQATVGYPKDTKLSGDSDSSCTLTNEKKDYEIFVALTADTNYDEEKAYYKEYDLFKEGKFGGFDGYSYKESDYSYEVCIYLGKTEYENEALTLSFDISSASRSGDKSAESIFKLADVQSILNSVQFLGKNPEAK